MSRCFFVFFISIVGCSSGNSTGVGNDANPIAGVDTAKVPLNELSGTYRGFQGGLYPRGSNNIPATHAAAGVQHAKNVRPLDISGNPTATGKYVLLSLGMSNTTQEFCGGDVTIRCAAESFIGQALADASLNKTTLALVDGAQGGQDALTWTNSSAPTYVEAARRLNALGLSERQVQIVWLKEANAGPVKSLPDPTADAYVLETRLGQILRAIKIHYPNVQQVFLTSRIYAGFATSALNPEPYAYESGFAVKWLIQAQIDQMDRSAVTDATAGDLNYNTVAPWIAWGPYPWAAGVKARSDGLTWTMSDFGSDGTHPSTSGRAKVAVMLLDFFKNSPFTRCWFVQGQRC